MKLTDIKKNFKRSPVTMNNICPKCESQHIRHLKTKGLYLCGVCNHHWADGITPPDWDELISCNDCWGTGIIYAYVGDSNPKKCTTCKGSGWL